MIRTGRRRFWRWGTILPAVTTSVAGLCAAVAVAGGSGAHVAATPAAYDAHSPIGGLNTFAQVPGGISATGWAYDPDSPTTALRAYALVDFQQVIKVTANLNRPDVARLHPSAGPLHGFAMSIPVPEGKHTVCVRVVNVGAGSNAHFSCLSQVFDYGPFGRLDSVTASHGALHVRGWAIDNDNQSTSLTTRIYVDRVATTVLANQPRPDVQQVHPSAGSAHGYLATLPVAQGAHTVCVTVVNIGFGSDNSFGCRTVTLDDSPRGALETAAQHAGALRVAGWAFDPEAPNTSLTVTVTIDGVAHAVLANRTRTDIASAYRIGSAHGFDASYALPEGTHTVCVRVPNLQFGRSVALPCRTATLNFTPTAALAPVTPTRTGVELAGWATDPDTSAALSVAISVDGRTVRTVTADAAGATHSGHNFALALNATSGSHRFCAVAINAGYGTRNSPAACRTLSLAFSPIGYYDSLTRVSGANDIAVRGWALDPDTTAALPVTVTVDGAPQTATANAVRTDVEQVYPGYGSRHGLQLTLPTDDGEHTVCLTVPNAGSGGTALSLGCKIVNAVHPVAPGAVRSLSALAGYGGATLTWAAPLSDGGAPWSGYVVRAHAGGATGTVVATVPVGAAATTATVTGLKPSTAYTFDVAAVNVAGSGAAVSSATVTTQASPPPQTTPAPVSTSRYIRNIRGASATEQATMRAEGLADAQANPSGHGYLILLDIGGQDQYDGGVVLSATTRFVTYGNLLTDIKAYVDGYAAGQRPSAPVTIAIGTNNDMDVNATTGRVWATALVNPLVAYARKYPGMTVAGANDIEPGFRATYSATKSWLSGYLGATTAPFVFNGSADGCAWTVINRSCNNGYSMAGLYYLAAGAAPVRMLNLPQIYNTTMADQWKYISLTGVAANQPRINFAGTLTEWTACDQTNSCGSLTGRTAWSRMWQNLQSDPRLKVGSLPYATDLRIDR